MAGPYTAGQGVRVSAAFTDSTGAAIDPTTVTLKFAGGSAAEATWTYGGVGSIVKDSVGNYHAVFDTTALSGPWQYVWQGTGAVLAIAAGSFQVNPPPL